MQSIEASLLFKLFLKSRLADSSSSILIAPKAQSTAVAALRASISASSAQLAGASQKIIKATATKQQTTPIIDCVQRHSRQPITIYIELTTVRQIQA